MSTDQVISGPLSVGQIVSRTFQLYRAHFGQFLLAAAIFIVPSAIVGNLAVPSNYAACALVLILQVLAALAGPLLAALVITSLVLATLQGQATSIRQSLREAWSRIGTYIGATFLQGLAALAALGPGYLLLVLYSPTPGLLLLLPGVALCAYLALSWSVTAPAILADGEGAVGALGRSRELTRGHLWRIMGLWLIIWLIFLLLAFLLGTVTTLIGGVVEKVLDGATTILLWPLDVIAAAVLYLELRARSESSALTPLKSNEETDPTARSARLLARWTIAVLVLEGLYWLGIAALQLTLSVSGQVAGSIWIVGVWNLMVSGAFFWNIRQVTQRRQGGVKVLTNLALVGGGWGLFALIFLRGWVQLPAIVLFVVLLVLVRANQGYYQAPEAPEQEGPAPEMVLTEGGEVPQQSVGAIAESARDTVGISGPPAFI